MCPLDIQRSLKDTLKLNLKFGSDWWGWGVAAGGTSDDHDLKPTCAPWRLKGQNPPFLLTLALNFFLNVNKEKNWAPEESVGASVSAARYTPPRPSSVDRHYGIGTRGGE